MSIHFDIKDAPETTTLKNAELVPQNVDEDDEYTVKEQRKIIHKIDRRLLPALGLMQAVSFLDRANMSNAAIAGMTKDLGLKQGHRYVRSPSFPES